MQQNDKNPPRGRGRPRKYPWLELDVGDSFTVPGKDTYGMSRQYCWAGKRYGRKFAAEAIIEDGRICCQITRTA